MPKIIHIITGLATGGAEVMLSKLARELRRRGFEQRVVSLMDKGTIGALIEQAGVPVEGLGIRRGIPSWKGLHRLVRVVKDYGPDLIQGWMYHANVSATLAARGRVPVIWGIRQSLYDLSNERPGTRLVILLGRPLARGCVRIVYNSSTSARQHELQGYPAEKSLVVGNGFDLERFRPEIAERTRIRAELGVSGNAVVAGNVARYHPMKDHACLLDAFAIVARKWPDTRLVMAGAGVDPDNEELCNRIQAHALSDQISLLGERNDVDRLMKGFDVYISSSAWGEGFPNVVGEAMSCSVPCIVTDVGDSSTIVGNAGWLVPPRQPQALAEAISPVLSMSPDARASMGRLARERIIQNYALSTVGDSYQHLYEEVSLGWHNRTGFL